MHKRQMERGMSLFKAVPAPDLRCSDVHSPMYFPKATAIGSNMTSLSLGGSFIKLHCIHSIQKLNMSDTKVSVFPLFAL